jgi:hypothetical protein
MSMKEHVRIERRFLRSIRIDSDLGDAKALEGFVCPKTSADVLLSMARHVSETGQGAFTWTGPYGSGKSSLVVALSALLKGNADLQRQGAKVFGHKVATELWKALPTGTKGWHILPVVGRRENPVRVIGEAMQTAGLVARPPRSGWTESNLIETVTDMATANPKCHGGLIIFVDEMGKFLEAAAQDGSDFYAFQQLAEVASRSNGRLLIVGILHQAFEEYARRLSREMRDEWAKIQGRFIDLAVNTAGEEQIDLLSRAIKSDHRPNSPSDSSFTVASIVHRDRPAETERLALLLENCWPLHPVVACLLGPVSRRRFGQNQRSIFGFLNSAEPHGFQDFVRRADNQALYGPEQLWDYLRANLEPSILASPDGHRWALAAEALERCEGIGGEALHIQVLKTIAVVDLFKERSGLVPNLALLRACLPDVPERALKNALKRLDSWSFTLFKRFLDAYAIFAGSDFDIDEAVRNELAEVDSIDFTALKALAGLQPILAKRHYHETGAMRWFEVNLAPLSNILEVAEQYQPESGSVGQFLLAIPTEGESEEVAALRCSAVAGMSAKWDIVAGLSKRSTTIMTLARELIALERVRNNRPELAGDAVARREVTARLATLQGQIESELHRAFDSAKWFLRHQAPNVYRHADLNSLASEFANRRFKHCPKLHNELLNRQKPSSSAVAAQNALLRRMVLNEGEQRLGIDGYPAEGGLFASLFEATQLYKMTDNGWCFVPPCEDDPCRLNPIWEAAANHIKTNNNRTIAASELYDLWRTQPFGVKEGLLPVLATAFIISQRNNLAIYRDGMFRARFDDIDVENLAKDPTFIQLRWMDLSDVARRLLSGMAEIVRTLDQNNMLVHLEPIDVARGLIGIFGNLPQWTRRTMRLSSSAIRVRDLFKRAHDPNKFLFDDIPAIVSADVRRATDKDLKLVISGLHEGLEELVDAYPSMLQRLRDIMLFELEVPNLAPQSLTELRERAKNIRQLAGDFHVEAFVGRLSHFDGSNESFEGIASLAVSKPPRDWIDLDLDRALVDITELAQKFLRAETFARVKGRTEKRHSMAIFIGMEGRPATIHEEFHVADTDRDAVNAVIKRVTAALEKAEVSRRSIILAALAELSANYMAKPLPPKTKGNERAAS